MRKMFPSWLGDVDTLLPGLQDGVKLGLELELAGTGLFRLERKKKRKAVVKWIGHYLKLETHCCSTDFALSSV